MSKEVAAKKEGTFFKVIGHCICFSTSMMDMAKVKKIVAEPPEEDFDGDEEDKIEIRFIEDDTINEDGEEVESCIQIEVPYHPKFWPMQWNELFEAWAETRNAKKQDKRGQAMSRRRRGSDDAPHAS